MAYLQPERRANGFKRRPAQQQPAPHRPKGSGSRLGRRRLSRLVSVRRLLVMSRAPIAIRIPPEAISPTLKAPSGYSSSRRRKHGQVWRERRQRWALHSEPSTGRSRLPRWRASGRRQSAWCEVSEPKGDYLCNGVSRLQPHLVRDGDGWTVELSHDQAQGERALGSLRSYGVPSSHAVAAFRGRGRASPLKQPSSDARQGRGLRPRLPALVADAWPAWDGNRGRAGAAGHRHDPAPAWPRSLPENAAQRSPT